MIRNISLMVSLALVFSFGGNCKKPDSDWKETAKVDFSLSAVVVFSVGESKVAHADGTEEKAQLGTTVKTGDTIITGPKGKVDLQFVNGSSIRIAPSTTLDFAKLAMNSSGGRDTKLDLASGKLFVNVNKAKKEDEFTVVTPTSIAGVRGTSFVVENDTKKNRAQVRVVEGSVSMAPRIAVLEGFSKEQIQADNRLSELRASLQQVEVIIEKGQQSSMPANLPELVVSDIESLDLGKISQVVTKDKPVVVPSMITLSDEQELKTIVTVDEETALKIIDLNQQGNATDSATQLAEIEKQRKEIEDSLASAQNTKKKEFETSLAEKPRPLETNKEIVNFYERIEKIILIDGKVEIGAIINQENQMMIVHTEKGIQKIPMEKIQEVIYDFQTKSKF